MTVPPYQPAAPGGGPAHTLRCPKCEGAMRTYERNGVHLEQCENCRGIFLDFGELESLTRLEARFAPQQAPPPPPPAAYPPQAYPQQGGYGPGWGNHGGHHYRRGGFGRLFFSS